MKNCKKGCCKLRTVFFWVAGYAVTDCLNCDLIKVTDERNWNFETRVELHDGDIKNLWRKLGEVFDNDFIDPVLEYSKKNKCVVIKDNEKSERLK